MARRQLSFAPDVSINVGRWRADGGLGHHSLLLARSLTALFFRVTLYSSATYNSKGCLFPPSVLTLRKITYERNTSASQHGDFSTQYLCRV